jgi:hypothetical protein
MKNFCKEQTGLPIHKLSNYQFLFENIHTFKTEPLRLLLDGNKKIPKEYVDQAFERKYIRSSTSQKASSYILLLRGMPANGSVSIIVKQIS